MYRKKISVTIALVLISLFIFCYHSFFSSPPSGKIGSFLSKIDNLFLFPLCSEINDFTTNVFYALNKNKISSQSIVAVLVDDNTLKNLKQPWSNTRSFHAEALDILKQEGAKVVGFDFLFQGVANKEEDEKLLAAIKQFNGSVVLAYFLQTEIDPDKNYAKRIPVYPIEEFRKNATTAFIEAPADEWKVIRQVQGFMTIEEHVDFSFTVKIAGLFLDVSPQLKDKAIYLKDKKIPIDNDGRFNINFSRRPADVAAITLNDLVNRNFAKDFFRGKIVIVMPIARIFHDFQLTPLGTMPGGYIHLNGILTILSNKFLKDVPFFAGFAAGFIILMLLAYILNSFSFLRGLFLSLGVFLALFWISVFLKFYGWQFPYGRIIVSSCSFLLTESIYSYAIFLSFMLKIRDKMTTDPITAMFNLRYLYEKIYSDSRSIPRKARYIVIIICEGVEFLFKGESVEKEKELWSKISSNLRVISRFWARYREDAIIGAVAKPRDLIMLQNTLKFIFASENIKTPVKLGQVYFNPGNSIEDLSAFLYTKVRESKEELVNLDSKSLPANINKKIAKDTVVSSLYQDAEERNRELLRIIERLKDEERKTKEALLELVTSLVAAIESKDSYTKGHTQRVCEYALMLADKLALPGEERDKIRKAALLHDLGKIGIPDGILHKKGRLTNEEYDVIKQHPVMTGRILEPIKEFANVIPYALHHHEKFDGTGYPQGLAGEKIPLGARVIAVADVFDALTTGRDYKEAYSVEDTIKEMIRVKGKQFDPVLIDKFIELLKETGMLPSG